MKAPASCLPSPVSPGFLAELRDHLATFCATLRTRRDYPGLLQAEIAQDIIADATAQQGRAGALAYTAEQADLEADRLLTAAQQPDSDGGPAITPHEAGPILRHIRRSATADHRITEVLA